MDVIAELSGFSDGIASQVNVVANETREVNFTLTPVLADTDNDGTPDASDNCPQISNPGQENADGDAEGNACDDDDDNDGVSDADETVVGTNPLVNEPAAAVQIINSILMKDD